MTTTEQTPPATDSVWDDPQMAAAAEAARAAEDAAPGEDGPEEGKRKRRKRSDAGQPRGPRGPRSPRANKATTALAAKITSGFNMLGAVLYTVDQYDSMVVAANAEKLGNAWAPVIQRNPRLVALIAQVEQGGMLGAAIIATAGVILPILAHHRPDILPPPVRVFAEAMAPKGVPTTGPNTTAATGFAHAPDSSI